MKRFSQFRSRIALLLLGMVLATGSLGCVPKEKKERSANTLQAFKSAQAKVETPYGKIKVDSAKEINGKIEYQTADGRRWRVTPVLQQNGAFKYEDLEEVK